MNPSAATPKASSKPTKILVTGSGGFVGSALCQEAARRGMLVTAAYRSRAPKVEHQNIRAVSVGDLANGSLELDGLLDDIDCVVHLASRAHHSDRSLSERQLWELYYRANVVSTQNLLNAASKAGVQRFVYLSSVKAVAEESQQLLRTGGEERPEDVYGKTKRAAEVAVVEAAKLSSMDYVILRPPLVYGPGVRANFLNLIRLVDKRVPMPVAGLKNRRSYVYLGNLVDACLSTVLHPNAANQVYYVSDGKGISTPHLLNSLGKGLGRPVRMFSFPVWLLELAGRVFRKGPLVRKVVGSLEVSNQAICSGIEWTPKWDFQSGLEATLEWYRKTSQRG